MVAARLINRRKRRSKVGVGEERCRTSVPAALLVRTQHARRQERDLEQPTSETWTDEEIISRILAAETDLFEIIMRRYSTRLYRVAFSILRDEAEAEDVMQDAYVRAYQHLDQFAGRAKFSTWLTRIAVNEAIMRKRRKWRCQSLDANDEEGTAHEFVSAVPNPEQVLSRKELASRLESAILTLPENYRLVLITREVHELSVAETADCLGISEENVKIRLYRARAALRRELDESGREWAFTSHSPFPPARWDRGPQHQARSDQR